MVFHTNPCKFQHFWTVVKSFLYAFKGSNCLLWIKRRFEPHDDSGNILTVWKFQNLQGFVWKTTQTWLGGKSCFSHTNPSNFQRPLRSQLLKYTAENLQVTLLKYALSVSVDKSFQKQTVFIFSESWSHDQLMQKAYWERMVIFQTQFHRPLHSSGTTLFKQNTTVWDFYYFWDSVIQFECTRV